MPSPIPSHLPSHTIDAAVATKLDETLNEFLRSIGRAYLDTIARPDDQILKVVLGSKVRQYQSMQVMKGTLTSLSDQIKSFNENVARDDQFVASVGPKCHD